MKKLSHFLFLSCVIAGLYSCDKVVDENVEEHAHEHLTSLMHQDNDEVCGTPIPTKSELQARARASTNYRTVDVNQPICINVFFHIVRNTDGSGGYPQSNLGVVIDSLNRTYNKHGIYFNSAGHDFIDNSAFTSIDSEQEAEQLGNVNVKQNAIDYYIVNNLWPVEGGIVTGTALSIPSKRLVIRSDRVTTSTSSHEIGHCLDLLHTHQGTQPGSAGCAENIDGSNCATCGDEICDTPADDGNGTLNGYNPDQNNIMSYYFFRHRFSNGQVARMKTTISNNSM
ncbi:MAG: M43 family zinc metalloprotease [Sphingobacterium sp.]